MLHVLMATRRRPDLLERTLNSLAACARPASYADTIVVENGEQQGAELAVRRAPSGLHATYLFHSEANKSASLNAALERIGDGLIVFLDDDVIVGETVLTAYARAADGIAGGVFFGGPTFPDYEVAPAPWLVDYLPPSARGWSLPDDVGPVATPSFLGCNWAAFVSDLNAVGGFDPSVGPGAATGGTGQERGMQRRLLDAERTGRYVPDAKVWHRVPRERCSPSWAFHRMYRDGITRGLTDRGAAEVARVFGYPRWAIRKTTNIGLHALASCGHPRSKENLDAIKEFMRAVGYLKGSRLALRTPLADAKGNRSTRTDP